MIQDPLHPDFSQHLTMLGSKVLEPQTRVEKFPNPYPEKSLSINCRTDEFSCKCPVTGQPDFAAVEIEYVPDGWIVESKSLKLYLWSFRDEAMFHEYLAHKIADYLDEELKPRFLSVKLLFNPRGGIAITATASRSRGYSVAVSD